VVRFFLLKLFLIVEGARGGGRGEGFFFPLSFDLGKGEGRQVSFFLIFFFIVELAREEGVLGFFFF